MKNIFLLIVAPVLLIALGFGQPPSPSNNTSQDSLKGCLSGSEGNYTVAEDGTTRTFTITGSMVDLKPHVGHDIEVSGQGTTAASSGSSNNFAVTAVNMISEHCAPANGAAPLATANTPSEAGSTSTASAVAPAATASIVAENAITPAAADTPSAETVLTPAATPAPAAEIVVTPAATVGTPSETVSPHAALARRRSETPAAVTPTPDVSVSSSSETTVTPDTTAAATPTPTAITSSSSSDAASTPAAAAKPPAATSRGWSMSFLIAFAVLIIVIGTMVPVFSKWRKRRLVEQRGAENLSFNREESSDEKSEEPGPRKAA